MNSGDRSGKLSKSDKRRSDILQILMEGKSAQMKDLAEMLDVSPMTIHRDIRNLQMQGVVRRVRGSVSAEKSVLFESSYFYRRQKHQEEKRKLAKAAVKHIEPGNAIIWDDSTTTYHVCDYISDISPVTVITNGLPVLNRFVDEPDIDVISLGGKYHRGYNGFFGINCEQAIKSYHVDVALMSATTVQGLSLYTQDELVVRVKQAMISIARNKILLIDSSKFQFSALNYVAKLTDFDLVIASGTIDFSVREMLTTAGVNLEIV